MELVSLLVPCDYNITSFNKRDKVFMNLQYFEKMAQAIKDQENQIDEVKSSQEQEKPTMASMFHNALKELQEQQKPTLNNTWIDSTLLPHILPYKSDTLGNPFKIPNRAVSDIKIPSLYELGQKNPDNRKIDEIKTLVKVPELETYVIGYFERVTSDILYIGDSGYPIDTPDIEDAIRFSTADEAYDFIDEELSNYRFTRKSATSEFKVFRERLEYTTDEREKRKIQEEINSLEKKLSHLKDLLKREK